MITCTMIPCIKYISPALVFNKIFLKLYSILVTILFLIQTSWFYIDLILNRFVASMNCISWIGSDLFIINCSYNNKCCSVIMLWIIGVISTYIICYSLN